MDQVTLPMGGASEGAGLGEAGREARVWEWRAARRGGAWDGGVAKGGGGALERNGEGVRVGASWGAGICIGRRDLRWAELVDEEVF